jgi:hypothetical protein
MSTRNSESLMHRRKPAAAMTGGKKKMRPRRKTNAAVTVMFSRRLEPMVDFEVMGGLLATWKHYTASMPRLKQEMAALCHN